MKPIVAIVGRPNVGKSMYLKGLTPEDRRKCFDDLFLYDIPALVIARNLDCFPECLESAQRHEKTLLRTPETTVDFTSHAIEYLNRALAPCITRHGVLLDIYGEGVMLTGDSGIGKSETAIELIMRGHRLVADDAVEIRRVSNQLIGTAPEVIRHYIELRGIGVIDVRQLFGMIVLGPGSLYTSIIPNLLVDGIVEAIQGSNALKVYVCNVMTQEGETEGYSTSDHIAAIFKHSAPGLFNLCLTNSTPISEDVTARYAEEGAEQIVCDLGRCAQMGVEIVLRPVAMAALLTSVLDSSDKVAEYINECKECSIALLPPDINRSCDRFAVEDGGIRFGLVAIKNIGRGFILSVMRERETAPFRSLQEFCERMSGSDINKRAVENLIRSGAFDAFGARRSQLIAVYETVMDSVAGSKRQNLDGQLDFFSLPAEGDSPAPVKETPLPDIPEFSPQELMTMQLSDKQQSMAEEFRLRAGRAMTILLPEGELNTGQTVVCEDLESLCNLATEFSRYAAESLRDGYLPVQGGCRVGLCGTAVMKAGVNTNLKDFSSAVVRIAREKRGIAESVVPELFRDGSFPSTLILSPPGGGKTTFLRDLVRCLSDGVGCPALRMALADERGEVAVMYRGAPQMDVGSQTDVLDGCPKALAIPMVKFLNGMIRLHEGCRIRSV